MNYSWFQLSSYKANTEEFRDRRTCHHFLWDGRGWGIRSAPNKI